MNSISLHTHAPGPDRLQDQYPLAERPTTTQGKVRVLHLINGEHYSGAERVQDLLALNLPKFGYQAGFVCLAPGKFPTERKYQEAPLYSVPMRNKFDFGVAREIAKIVQAEEYQILNAHTVRSVAVARLVATLARVPFVYHVHSPAANDSTRKFANRINAWTERLSLTGVNQIITVSSSLARHMTEQGFDPGRITVVPNGVACRKRLETRLPPSTTWTLGTIALFRPRKGTEVLLEALASLRNDGHRVRLRAVGPFETEAYRGKIMQQAAVLGLEDAIDWTGFTDNVDAELRQMDLFVLPSLFGEGLPMVVLEAMAAGVPVIGTRVEGTPEVLCDGAYGLIAEPGDGNDLAGTILRVIRGEVDWSQLRELAWARQSERYSDTSMAHSTANVYNQVLATVK